jgi:type I restriction enzyme, S subunit
LGDHDSLLEIETASARIEHEIALIREYRTRLIADMVTGKLDVRDVKLP